MDERAVNTSFGGYQTPHADLREWLGRIEGIGELKRIEGADWNLEMGAIAEMIYHANPENPPALLFEKIPGYPDDFKVLSGMTNSAGRLAVTLGFDAPSGSLDVVRDYRNRLKTFEMHPALHVDEGAVLQNVDRDDEVDLYKFPVPFLHEEDGGRYIGTGDLVIMRDPDDDWVNIGTYRVVVHDKNMVGL
ncbi:MAG: UbiD family decarboxylase, partial [Rhodospirillales bacterium]|nr:UbiD family decarboxylase [Rhodospirillales bacterium]